MLRLLIIDDSDTRIDTLKQWLPGDVHPVVATSAGRALRMIDLDPGAVYAGILLDHDLGQQVVNDAEHGLTGLDVARRLVVRISPDVPILVHSMSWQGGRSITQLLEGSGFSVTRIRFEELSRIRLLDWLEDVRAEQQFRSQNCLRGATALGWLTDHIAIDSSLNAQFLPDGIDAVLRVPEHCCGTRTPVDAYSIPPVGHPGHAPRDIDELRTPR